MPTWVYVLVAGVGVAVFVLVLFLILRGRRAQAPAVCAQCGRSLLPTWDKCMFCGWKPRREAAIEFLCGPLTGQIVNLQEDVLTIGSIGGNSIVLADPAVSRKHLAIRRLDEAFEMADLGSTNGVYVNGQRTAKRKLVAGDVIRVGTSEMVFRLSGRVV